MGWDVDVPNIQFSQDPAYNPDVPQRHRAFLSLGGFGGELLQDPNSATDPDGSGYIWRVRDEQYLKVRSSCAYIDCPSGWTVWDKNGTKYSFGGGQDVTTNYRRFYFQQLTSNSWATRDYRADVASIQDARGNHLDFTYQQQRLDSPSHPGNLYVMAAYPYQITYNGGQALIQFNIGCDNYPANGPNVCMRNDVPRNVPSGCGSYYAPQVMDTQRLNQIEIRVSGSLVRRYDFTMDTTAFTAPGCPPAPQSGFQTLRNVKMLDRTLTSYPYTTTAFTYATQHHGFKNTNQTDAFAYDLPHLTQINNAFGGQVFFTYQEKNNTNNTQSQHWSRSVVTQERHSYGGSQADVITTFTYNVNAGEPPGPEEQDLANPLNQTADPFNSEYRGFRDVTETDASGNQIVHNYYTTNWSSWLDEVRTGREYDTVSKDSTGAQWQRMQTTWSVRPIWNVKSGGDYFVNFVYSSSSVTTLRDGTTLTVNNTFDNNNPACTPAPAISATCYGLLTVVDDLGVPATGDRVITDTVYIPNTTKWLFLPGFVEKLDADHGSALLTCDRNYYDGANSSTAAPVLGLLTAKSTAISATRTQCDFGTAFTQGTNLYMVYETYNSGTATYGNVAQSSAPTYTAPESQPAGNAFGWIPSGVAYASAIYDSTHHIFPKSQSNALSQTTTTAYDYVIAKPTQVTEPNGHVTTIVYDNLGRVLRGYDNLDSDAYPTEQYSYTWGTVPNQTVVQRLSQRTSPITYRASVSCMDGFGRQIEHLESYAGANLNSVRADYDARGKKAVVANPVDAGSTSAQCPTTPVTISTRDRTAYAYDALGNVTTTNYLAANQTPTPATCTAPGGTPVCSQVIYNGLTTTAIDERIHAATKVRNPAALQVSVTDALNVTTTQQSDELGRLTKVTDAAGNHTDYTYDLAGRKTGMNDPDLGAWSYTYDAAGNMLTQTDARSIVTTMTYDALNRVLTKMYSFGSGTPDVYYTYDAYDTQIAAPNCSTRPNTGPNAAVGHMTYVRNFQEQHWSCFDLRGEETTTRYLLNWDSCCYDVLREFDPLGQLSKLTYPDGDVVTYPETAQGDITGLASSVSGTLVSNATRTPWLAPKDLPLVSYEYDYRERLTHIQSVGQNFFPAYDDAGNVRQTTELGSLTEQITYGYDNVNRLVSGTGFRGSLSASYTYDPNTGNMLTKTEGASALTLCYPAGGASHPHAVTSVYNTSGAQCNSGTPWLTMTYDADGNLSTQGASTYAYDANLRPTQINTGAGQTQYWYDAAGTLVHRGNPGGSYAEYIGGIFEKTFTSQGVATGVTKYYAFAGRRIAMRTPAGAVEYFLADHLGSTIGLLDSTGAVVTGSLTRYWPYGGTRVAPTTTVTDKLYTGQQQEASDPTLNLYDYNARFYSTALGHFIGADASSQDGYNRYMYVRDNPLRATDPTGLDMLLVCGVSDACEHGRSGNMFRRYVKEYWRREKISFGSYTLDQAFDMLQYALAPPGDDGRGGLGWNTRQTLGAFRVGFIDASDDVFSAVKNCCDKYVDKINRAVSMDSSIDMLLGYSEGGSAIGYWLIQKRENHSALLNQIAFVVLIEPAFNRLGPDNLDANDFPGITFDTRNGDRTLTTVHGTVANNPNSFYDNPCGFDVHSGYHCAHQDTAELDIDVAFGQCYPGPAAAGGIACTDGRYWHR